MSVIAILSVFAGMIIGFRMKVLALIPVMFLTGAAVFAVFAIRGEGLMAALGAGATAIIAIQIGYLCWTFAASLKEEPAAQAVAVSESAAGRSATVHR